MSRCVPSTTDSVSISWSTTTSPEFRRPSLYAPEVRTTRRRPPGWRTTSSTSCSREHHSSELQTTRPKNPCSTRLSNSMKPTASQPTPSNGRKSTTSSTPYPTRRQKSPWQTNTTSSWRQSDPRAATHSQARTRRSTSRTYRLTRSATGLLYRPTGSRTWWSEDSTLSSRRSTRNTTEASHRTLGK